MSNNNIINYYFPYLRRGLGARLDGVKSSDDAKRAQAEVVLKIHALRQGADDVSREIKKKVSLYGPGDVLGFDAKAMVVRTEPISNDGSFLAHHIPFIEFAEADFPWRYSAVRHDDKYWIPWLTLIVLKQREGNEPGEYELLNTVDPQLPPRILLRNEAPLPDLSQAWRWAHVHLNERSGLNYAELQKKLVAKPQAGVSRLLCPRRLKAGTAYCCFVVPTYRLGLEAAMGILHTETKRFDFSWQPGEATGEIELPYYYKWDFRTGTGDDFEQIARRIKPHLIENMEGQEINVSNPGYGMKSSKEELQLIRLGGALQSSDTVGESSIGLKERNKNSGRDQDANPKGLVEQEKILKDKLKQLLSSNETKGVNGEKILQVVPPIYGQWIEPRIRSFFFRPQKRWEKNWGVMLNLDFRHRIAAGLGVQYVQENQEALFEAASKQLSRLVALNRSLNLKRCGRELSRCFYKRLSAADKAVLLDLSLPVHQSVKLRISAGDGEDITTLKKQRRSIRGHLTTSSVPNTLANQKARKYFRSHYKRRSPQQTVSSKRSKTVDKQQYDSYHPIFDSNLRLDNEKLFPSKLNSRDLPSYGAQLNLVLDKKIVKMEEFGVQIKACLDPDKTIEKRTCRQIEHVRAWEDGHQISAQEGGDPLRSVMAYPEFHAPMYRYLLQLSKDYFLPGIEQIPQNAISAVVSNRKFIEAFMIGLNHEFAAELRWREYPTDMRGSFFRKFWDTSIYSVDDKEKKAFRDTEQGRELLARLNMTGSESEWKRIEDAYFDLTDDDLAEAYEEAVERWLLEREEDKDIQALHTWKKDTSLGEHAVRSGNKENSGDNEVVIVLRAELLQKFPNVFIYLVEKGNGDPFKNTSARVYPKFEASLPPDIVCLGFPFPEDIARNYYIVFEERLSEQHMGLDIDLPAKYEGLDDLSWPHFDGMDAEGYIDGILPNEDGNKWTNPALIAQAFTQKQVRVVFDLDLMLP